VVFLPPLGELGHQPRQEIDLPAVGRTFAIVGLGRIGIAAAVRAKAIGSEVAFYDPYRQDGFDKALDVRRVESLADLFRQAFVVSLHCPLTPETRHLVNAESPAWLPHGAYLVNTACGSAVDTAGASRGQCGTANRTVNHWHAAGRRGLRGPDQPCRHASDWHRRVLASSPQVLGEKGLAENDRVNQIRRYLCFRSARGINPLASGAHLYERGARRPGQ
jgi:hypothetical protein